MASQSEKVQSTPIYFDDRLKKSLRIACANAEMSLTGYVCEAVQEKMDREKESVEK